MNFTDPIFYPFLAACFLLYYIFPLKVRFLVLLAGSTVFYATWGVEKLYFTLAAGLIGYLSALLMQRMQDRIMAKQEEQLKAEGRIRGETGEDIKQRRKKLQEADKKKLRALKRRVFFPAVIILLLHWILTKAAGSLTHLLTLLPSGLTAAALIVPVGISYYTLSIIGYLADVYYGKTKAEKNPLKFMTFVLWFPKLLQGPIEDFKKVRAQLGDGNRFDYKGIAFGVQLLLYGLFKKLVIADRMSLFLAGVFANTSRTAGIFLLIGFIFRALQLYFDFSGYMDIAEGISEIFGIHMSPNFNRPFFSKGAAEFWRRWHISLGVWFKNYVYMPISVSAPVMGISKWFRQHAGKQAARNIQTAIPLMIVWLLTGLWHGTGLNYILWGIYWGGLILMSTVFAPQIKKLTQLLRIDTNSGIWEHVQMYRTFLLFVIGRWLTMPLPRTAVREMVRHFNIGYLFDGSGLYQFGLNFKNFWLMTAAMVIVWMISRAQEKGSVREKVAGYPLVIRWALYYALLFAVIIFGLYGPGYNASAFVYMQY